jgi:muramoyltetrapeptide carboxypeptidase
MITRRELLGAGAALVVPTSPAEEPIRRPRALRPGDKVALLCPSGPAKDAAHLKEGADKIISLGWQPVIGRNAGAVFGYLAGTDEQRAADLNEALRDPQIRGIMALRGGYGAMRILDQIDYDALRRDPKVLMGFSDVTALHLAFLARGVVSFHAPCGESSWSEFSRATLPVLTSDQPFGTMRRNPGGDPLVTLHGGGCEGRLVGGNLSVLSALVGTPYAAPLEGSIVVLEDIGEDPYRVDRMLTQLLLAGLPKAAGLVFGNFRPRPRTGSEAAEPGRDFTMGQVWRQLAAKAGVPCFAGLPFGHVTGNHIVPWGVRARLDADARTLTILESATV